MTTTTTGATTMDTTETTTVYPGAEVAKIAPPPRIEQVRQEVREDPERLQMLRDATAELANAVGAFIEKYVVLPVPQGVGECNPTATTLALWAMHTWALGACDATPYLLIVSDGPGSGKTRLMETLSYVVRLPWQTSSTTPTALFRRMSTDRPTLFLDELDTVFRGGSSYEALRQVLNAGNRRGATVTRCDGKWGVIEYETFGAKCMAGIDTGFLPATIVDRSITVRMKKRAGEQVERLRPRVAAQESAPLARTLETWAMVSEDLLAAHEPALPAGLSDRACDAWEPLLAISEFAGSEWQERAQLAAQELSGATPVAELEAPHAGLLPAMQVAMGVGV